MIVPNNYDRNINYKALKIHKPSKIPSNILKALEETTPLFKDYPNASVKYKQKKFFNIKKDLWRNRFYRYFNTTCMNIVEFNLGEKKMGIFNTIKIITEQDTCTSLCSDSENLFHAIKALFKKYHKEQFDMEKITPEEIDSTLKYYQKAYKKCN